MKDFVTSCTSPFDFSEEKNGEIDREKIHRFHQIRDRFFKDMAELFGKKIMMIGIEWEAH